MENTFKNCVKDKYGQPLVCYGCAHSAAYMKYSDGAVVDGTAFPGMPSGERPCCFCIRNIKREEWRAETYKNHPEWRGAKYDPYAGKWYNGSQSVKVPMDCYHTCDMKDQIQRWTKE